MFTKCLFEFIGTAVLVLFGDGVVASTVLRKSKGENGGWIVITLAWGFAVMLGAFIAGPYSGAHLNPALTLALAIGCTFPWEAVVPYIIAQMLGGFTGAVLVYLFYRDHFNATDDQAAKLGTFCTAPAIRRYSSNLISEIIGTFMLVFVIFMLATPGNTPAYGLGSVGVFPVTMLIMALGMSLGGTTGYAINPARDLAPRIAHAILPIKGKGSSDWAYSWVPVAGPVIGAVLAAGAYLLIEPLVH